MSWLCVNNWLVFFVVQIYFNGHHSHVSLLIHMGFTALAIGNRVGHESEKITYRYAHLYPSVQRDMANKLNQMFQESTEHEWDEEDLEDEE